MQKITRSPEEIERYKNHHDPIQLWKKRLLEEGVLTEAEAEAIDEAAKEEADAAAQFAIDSDFDLLRNRSSKTSMGK
jgi:pyruvate dehydrogenase E1 component alpha subunit